MYALMLSYSIFSVCCLSRENSDERSTALGHALLIAPLNEVIHNVTTLWYTHIYSHTHMYLDHTLSFICLRTYWNQSLLGQVWGRKNLTA